MNTSTVTLLKRMFFIMAVAAIAGIMSLLSLTPPARADTPIFVRPGGHDLLCRGTVNADYSPAIAPACAVHTLPVAMELTGPADTIIIDTGSQILTIPPSESGEITAATVNLVVNKSDFPEPVQVGNPLTYTVRITNTGDTAASSLSLIDVLPHIDIVTFKSVTSSQGSCSPSIVAEAWLVGCELGTLGGGSANATVTIVVTPTAAGLINNEAIIPSTAQYPGARDNELTRVEGITNLSVRKTDDPDPVVVGEPLTYTITVTNSGPSAAAVVDLTDSIPGGTTLRSATPSQGSCSYGSTVTCALGLMGNNATATVTLVVTPTSFGLITNTVTVTGGDIDPDLSNNTFTETTTVIPAADIAVSKSDQPDPVAAGAVLTYTLVVSNPGPGPATDVTLFDTLPDAVSINNASGNMLLMHLDEVTGATTFTDNSGNNHDGICSGATCPTAGVSGKFDHALQFDGVDDFVSLGNPAGLNLSGQITMMAWVNISGTSGLQNIVAHGYTASPPAAVFLRIYNGNYEVGSWNGAGFLTSSPIPPADVGTWVHLAGVYDGSYWRLYRNGTLKAATPAPLGALPVSENWALGARGTGTERFFSGMIDEAAIFDRALTAGEIAALYDEPLNGIVSTSQGICGAVSGGVSCSLGDLPASDTATVVLKGTVTPDATGTLANTATVTTTASDPNQANNTDTETTTIQSVSNPGAIYLPIILRGFAGASISMYWNDWETVRDKVSPANGGPGLTPDGQTDGLFRVTLNMGSLTKRVESVVLTTNQSPGIYWDTIPTDSSWVLGIFDGGGRLNEADGTLNQLIGGVLAVTIYGSDTDPPSLFPPDRYNYTVKVNFDDDTSLSATARIPPAGSTTPPPPPPGGEPPPVPPPPPPPCEPVAKLDVGSQPRGVAVDAARSRAYVANYGSDSVSVIDTGSNIVLRTMTGITAANGITLDPDRNILWVTNHSSNRVTPIQNPDIASYTVDAPIEVGSGPWGVTYVNDNIYVVNNSGNSVTVIDTATLSTTTLSGSFNRPYHIAANPITGKVYVANFGNHTVTVINGTTVGSVVNLNVGDPSTQPYGIAVDELRNLVYVATVDSHRVVVIGQSPSGVPDQLLGWATFHRGFGDPNRPVPMRAIAVNPDIGSISPMDDGGHVWTTTSTADGGEADEALLIPKGWSGYFHSPVPCRVEINPSEGVAINRSLDRAYITSGVNPGTLSIFDDDPAPALVPFSVNESEAIAFELFIVE